jgi:hypothetical protein
MVSCLVATYSLVYFSCAISTMQYQAEFTVPPGDYSFDTNWDKPLIRDIIMIQAVDEFG